MACEDSVALELFYQPEAVAAFDFYETNNTVVFVNQSENSWDFVWDFGDSTAQTTDENPVHDYVVLNENVWYTVTLTAANQCMVDTIMVDILAFDIEELEGESLISIFPNPSNGIFSLNGKFPANEDFTLQIFNAYGQEIQSNRFNSFEGRINQNFDLSRFEAGIYFIQLQGKSQRQIVKVLID
ncbi:Uncharacterised protein [Candidatus Venteria ishoeyi]|uniref:PKD domain-containing protein n=2 Tax=Candidatus Venteria ishoeyi TaxID=1899563 RepID=A0A1H6F7Q1_9GAMM|nr:Uncharacterised protein [Candidatus Venteria ishoeyi]